MNLTKACCATLMAAMIVPTVLAKPPPSSRPTLVELGALPDYCQARFGKDERVREAFSKKLGPEHFLHIHHHCTGLNLLNREKVTFDKQLRRYYLQSAVGEFNYVLARWPADFVLTAEARSGKSMAEMLLKMAPSGR